MTGRFALHFQVAGLDPFYSGKAKIPVATKIECARSDAAQQIAQANQSVAETKSDLQSLSDWRGLLKFPVFLTACTLQVVEIL